MSRTTLLTVFAAAAAIAATARGLAGESAASPSPQAGPAGQRRLVPAPAALRLPADAIWIIRSDRKVDGRVEQGGQEDRLSLQARGDVLTGQYVGQRAQGKENASRFRGEVTRTPAGQPLLTLRQVDQWYAATYAGRFVCEGRFVGCWFDSDGRAGDFELVAEKQ